MAHHVYVASGPALAQGKGPASDPISRAATMDSSAEVNKPAVVAAAVPRTNIVASCVSQAIPNRPLTEAALVEAPTLSITGGGLFFFWQLGALQYIRVRYHTSKMHMVGTSAGALVTTVAACNVDPQVAVDSAYRIAKEAGIWGKKLGLLGIWGGLLRRWLEDILPEDAHKLCTGRLRMIATDLLTAKQKYITEFPTRQHLIDANMCSIHVPLFLDFRLFARYEGRPFVDGSLINFFRRRREADLLHLKGQSFVLDYTQDPSLTFSGLDFLKLKSYESVLELMQQGAHHAARIDSDGAFKPFFGGIARSI